MDGHDDTPRTLKARPYALPLRAGEEDAVGYCLSNVSGGCLREATMGANQTLTVDVLAVDDYDERPVETPSELEALVRLRAELSWTAWKAHPRFKKDRLLREAQRRFGALPAGPRVVVLEPSTPANDAHTPVNTEAELAADELYGEVCDARREAWMDAMDNDESEGGQSAAHGGEDHE
jgi:hypothetical protein